MADRTIVLAQNKRHAVRGVTVLNPQEFMAYAEDDDDLTYIVDMSSYLDGATISSVTRTPNGVTVSNTSNTTTRLTQRLKGFGYVDLKVTSSDGDVEEFRISIQPRAGTILNQIAAVPEATVTALTANRTYYVRTDGSDSNDGRSNTASGAFATLQKALDTYAALDLAGYTVTVQLGNGTHTSGGVLRANPQGAFASTPLTIVGDTTTPTNVVISTTSASCIVASDGARLYIEGVRLTTTTAGDGIQAVRGGEVKYGNVDFHTCAGFHKEANDHGRIYNNGNYSISGGAVGHEHCNNESYILNLSATVTLTGTPAFSSYYVGVSGAYVQYVSVTFSGSATGQRYLVHQNGIILSNSSGETYFPGNSLGSRVTNGVYSGLSGTVLNSIAGGTATNSTLTLKSTEGVGATDAIIFQVGNNGATEAARIETGGKIGVGISSGIDGQIEIGAGPAWSASNYGLNLAISGSKNNAIGLVDGGGGNPFAIVNNGGVLRVAAMPAFGNTGSAPQVITSADYTTWNFAVGALTPDRRFHAEVDDSSNSSVTQVARLTHTTSGTPAAGIGAGLEFEVETSAGNNEVGVVIEAVTTDVTSTSEDFDLVIRAMAGGATATEVARHKSTGTYKMPVFTVAGLPTGTAGEISFASNGRKNGEGAGLGTGVLVFHDGTAWRACDTGATVAA